MNKEMQKISMEGSYEEWKSGWSIGCTCGGMERSMKVWLTRLFDTISPSCLFVSCSPRNKQTKNDMPKAVVSTDALSSSPIQ